MTLAQAIALIDERAAKGGGKPKRGAKKAAPKKAAAKAKAPTDPDAPKPAKKAAVKKAAAKPKSEAVSKARAPVASAGQDLGGKAGGSTQNACEEERGQGPGISERRNTTMAFRPGTRSSPSSARSRARPAPARSRARSA